MRGVGALRTSTTPPKVFVAATGAGAGIQAALWGVPGSSAFLVGAAFPYADHETERFLGFRPTRFCDEETAVELAIASYLRGREAALADAMSGPNKPTVIGLGLTASVASLAPHRGDHRIFAASLSEDAATLWSARLPKGAGVAQRAIDGGLADRLGVQAILTAAGLPCDDEGISPGLEVSRRDLSETELRATLYRREARTPDRRCCSSSPSNLEV